MPAQMPKIRTFVRNLDSGLQLVGEVSPCVFMYRGYPLQVGISLRSGDSLCDKIFLKDPSKNAETYASEDVERLLDLIQILPCPCCGFSAIDPSVNGVELQQCESCRMAELHAELEKGLEKERKALAKEDAKMKKKGMVARVDAWVHPPAGDDYEITWYFSKRPTDANVKDLLKKQRSDVLDDFRIVDL
jgi:Zn-finger nucleic acid-binding protein